MYVWHMDILIFTNDKRILTSANKPKLNGENPCDVITDIKFFMNCQ